MKKIYFTVTNDLTYDQRMHRICTSLAENGFAVMLVGRKLNTSLPLTEKKFAQKRLPCWLKKGKLFYVEYNLRLLFYLLFRKIDIICAIDLDTIIPCYTISKLKGIPRVYDAHELFTELKEVVTRPAIKKIWLWVERRFVPKFKNGYTVSDGIAKEFQQRYGLTYETIRNIPLLKDMGPASQKEKFILYQGAVNEARGFEYLIPAMKMVDGRLVVCGDGNFMVQLKELINQNKLSDKVVLKGMLNPDELLLISQQAYIGVAVAENEGLNQYLALPNKFFDYLHAGLPQLTMNFPEYIKMNQHFEVALLINDLQPQTIAKALNKMLADDVLYNRLRNNCFEARKELNWQNEEKKLLFFYQSLIHP